MRIAILTNEYPPHVYGGAGVHVEYLTRELARLRDGHRTVEVLCFGDQAQREGNLRVEGIQTDFELPAQDPRHRRRTGWPRGGLRSGYRAGGTGSSWVLQGNRNAPPARRASRSFRAAEGGQAGKARLRQGTSGNSRRPSTSLIAKGRRDQAQPPGRDGHELSALSLISDDASMHQAGLAWQVSPAMVA